jgi:nucleoid DNA-binding protein
MTTEKWEERECNKRLINQTAEDLGINISQVENILGHFADFTARTIRSGSLEGVCVPYLGKFQVKVKAQQYKEFLHSLHPVIKKEFQKLPTENITYLLDEDAD